MGAVRAVFRDRKSIIRGGNGDALCSGRGENDIIRIYVNEREEEQILISD